MLGRLAAVKVLTTRNAGRFPTLPLPPSAATARVPPVLVTPVKGPASAVPCVPPSPCTRSAATGPTAPTVSAVASATRTPPVPPAAAKVIKTFKAEFTRPNLRAGVMDGKLLGTSELTMLADLPSAEVLRARLLGAIQAPAATLARLIQEPGARVARVIRSKPEAAAA